MTRDYVYDQGFAEERARLRGMETLWDPGTQALFDELGIGSGWRCLEVGAGGGSLLHWMTGRGAVVVAIDIDTRFIESLASDAIEVRRVDIRTDELPQGEFDLVHARLVLEHLTDRRQILDRLVATLRPGGWLVIEDYDWTPFGFGVEGSDAQLEQVTEAIIGFMQRAGFEPRYVPLVRSLYTVEPRSCSMRSAIFSPNSSTSSSVICTEGGAGIRSRSSSSACASRTVLKEFG